MITLLKSTLAGIALWSGFAPLEFFWGPILGFFLLFDLLSTHDIRKRFLFSFVTGLTFFLPLLHWSSVYVGSVPWLILALGQSAIFSLVAIPSIRRNLNGAAFFAAGFLMIELLRMKIPFGGFGWGRAGFTQVDSFTVIYPLLGVSGVTFILALLSAAARIKPLFLVGIITIIGVSQLDFFSNQSSKSTFRIIAVQGGVDKLGFAYNDNPMRVLQRHVDATPTNMNADLILWPENAIDVDPANNLVAQRKLLTLMQRLETNLLAGVVEQSDVGPMNSSLLFDSSAQVVSRYVKQDLAPFGEYIPFRTLAESISPFARQVNDFKAGQSWQPFRVKDSIFQSFICFEILDDDHVRDGARNMDFLVAQTNNATFGESPQAAQQLQIARARAAELRKEIAVVSTTGFTAHLNGTGDIEKQLTQFSPGALDMEIAQNPGNSPASRINSTMWSLWALLVFLTGLLRRYRDNR